jgi:beta-glucosidase
VALQPGQTKTVSIQVDPLYLSVFDVAADKWKIVSGEYEVQAGAASDDLPLRAKVKIAK